MSILVAGGQNLQNYAEFIIEWYLGVHGIALLIEI